MVTRSSSFRSGTIGRMHLVLLPALLVLSALVGRARGEFPDYSITFHDMKVKAGYYSEGGKYLGGIPELDPLRKGTYECGDEYHLAAQNDTATSSTAASANTDGDGDTNATACNKWGGTETAGKTNHLAECECKTVQNDAYCAEWTCFQVKEQEHCQSSGETTTCYSTLSTEPMICQCDVENASGGLYCDSWSCKQTDSRGNVYREDYYCQRESDSGEYCDAWNGNITTKYDIEAVTCECMREWSGDGVCSYWECEKRVLDVCGSDSNSWCNLGVSVGVGGVFGFFGIVAIGVGLLACFHDKGSSVGEGICMVFLGALWCFGWSSGVVIWGGVDGAVIVGAVWGVGLLVAIAMSCCFH